MRYNLGSVREAYRARGRLTCALQAHKVEHLPSPPSNYRTACLPQSNALLASPHQMHCLPPLTDCSAHEPPLPPCTHRPYDAASVCPVELHESPVATRFACILLAVGGGGGVETPVVREPPNRLSGPVL